ncbi:MAG: hypothetical protein IKJ77_00860 [Firmicutes bacterium]|nr:hypothetical protein [Bacillota bacterium]
MERTIIRAFHVDGDVCEVTFVYDEDFGKYFGDYPDFEETPKWTPEGKPWVTAMEGGCEHGTSRVHANKTCFDCGSCIYFRRENTGDLIGVCDYEGNRRTDRREET